MPHREDATVWIGYADFLSTLAILFFVVAVAFAARTPRGPAFVSALVQDANSKLPIAECDARIGNGQTAQTDEAGKFAFEVAGISERMELDLRVSCDGYLPYSQLMGIAPADTANLRIAMSRDGRQDAPGDSNLVEVVTIGGDALFERNDFRLTESGVEQIRQVGRAYKGRMRPYEVIAVQGHTDDLPFPPAAGKDNWVLSGERAAAAAKVLTDAAYGIGIPECQVLIMGFGPSRPVEPVTASDPNAVRDRKRARNRRIEFRKLRGTEIAGGTCA